MTPTATILLLRMPGLCHDLLKVFRLVNARATVPCPYSSSPLSLYMTITSHQQHFLWPPVRPEDTACSDEAGTSPKFRLPTWTVPQNH